MNPVNSDFSTAFLAFCRTATPDARLRFAPTPSGYLHLGNALNFTLNWLVARLAGARVLLRIDDLDDARKRPEYVQDIFDTLHWLGLDWDEGPKDVADFEKNWSQHLRLHHYNEALSRLVKTGLVFACGKSRRELAPFGAQYPPEFRHQGLALDAANVSWRIATPPDLPMPDFVLRRRDGIPAYQLASLVDDLLLGITHVVRGVDLEASTAAQQWLANLLADSDTVAPSLPWGHFKLLQCLHHPLILDATGQKLSKSAGADALISLRQGRQTPDRVFETCSRLLWPGGVVCRTASGLLRTMRAVVDSSAD